MKVIASLTTIPQRIDKIKGTLDSLLAQTYPIDHIEINVPFFCVRTNETYVIPAWLAAMPQVEIHRTADFGAITKISPTLLRHAADDDVYLWSVDDDHAYRPDVLAGLVKLVSHHPRDIIAYSIADYALWTKSRHRKPNLLRMILGKPRRQPQAMKIDNSFKFKFFEGFQTVLYPPHAVGSDFAGYIEKSAESLDCRKSDDVVLSYYFRNRCGYIKADGHASNSMFDYGRDAQALHLQDQGHRIRYQRVLTWLRANSPIN